MIVAAARIACSICALIASGYATASAQTLDQPHRLTAREIYDRAHARVVARRLPPFISYTMRNALDIQDNNGPTGPRVLLRTSDGIAYPSAVSILLRTSDGRALEQVRAQVPGEPRDAAPHRVDALDVVWPFSTLGFGPLQGAEAPSPFESRTTPEPQASVVPTIGSVTAVSYLYAVTLLDTERLDGALVYHLKLVPKIDPSHRVLRELYIDAHTFDPRRIVIETETFQGPQAPPTRIAIDYRPYGPDAWVIHRIWAEVSPSLNAQGYEGNIDYRTSDVAFPPSEPSSLFGETPPPSPLPSP